MLATDAVSGRVFLPGANGGYPSWPHTDVLVGVRDSIDEKVDEAIVLDVLMLVGIEELTALEEVVVDVVVEDAADEVAVDTLVDINGDTLDDDATEVEELVDDWVVVDRGAEDEDERLKLLDEEDVEEATELERIEDDVVKVGIDEEEDTALQLPNLGWHLVS